MIVSIEDKTLQFKKFFDKNFPKVKTFAWNLLKSEEDAEDVAQDIFIRLWEQPELWINRNKLDSYLYTLVRNQIFNFLKHKSVEQNYLEQEQQKAEWVIQEILKPDDELYLHELELLIEMALERMPTQRKTIYRMSREEGMTAAEIAERLGVSVRTVENHIYRALQDLKKIIVIFFFILSE